MGSLPNGMTVEINNTDAEGRLILIDAMAYAIKKYKPDTMVDLATLTGACMVALGDKIAGVFTQDQDLSDAIVAAGKNQRLWQPGGGKFPSNERTVGLQFFLCLHGSNSQEPALGSKQPTSPGSGKNKPTNLLRPLTIDA